MARPSRLFVGYRALGFTSNEIPLCVRYTARHNKAYIVTCVGRAFHTYQADKLAIVRVSNRLDDPITCLAVDDSFVFVGSGNTVYAFVRGKQIEFTYRGHKADVILLLPFASHLVSVDTNCCVKIWTIRKEEEYGQLQFNKNSFHVSALVHPRGIKNVILFGSRQGSLQLWNINTSKLLYTFVGWNSAVSALEQSPEEKVIAIGLEDGRTLVHNIVYDQTVLTVKQDWGEVTAISFRTDGEHQMCTGSSVGHIAVWDLEKRKLHSQIRCAHNAAVTGLKFLPSQPLLVTSSIDNSLKVWIFDQTDGSGRVLHERNGHSEPPIKVRFHGNDGKFILTAGEDSTLRCFSTEHDSYNKSLGRASYNKAKTKKSGLKADEHCMPAITDFASETARQSDWDGIAACHRSEGVVTTWNFNRCTMGAHKIRHPRFKTGLATFRQTVALCVDVSSCGNYCVVGYSSGHVDLYNIQSGQHRGTYGVQCQKQKDKFSNSNDQVREVDSTAHDGAVLGVSIDGINESTVTVGTDSFVRFWKFKSCKLIKSIEMDAIIAKSVLHRESAMLALALDNFQVSVVDVEMQRIVRQFSGHGNMITDMTFSADGRWLITSAMDSTVKTWDLPSGKLVDCFLVDIPVKSLSFSPTGMFLSTVHVGDLGVYLWSNMTMFGSAVLTPLPADYEPTILSLPSTDDKTKGEQDVVEDTLVESMESLEFELTNRISSNLITFSMLPQSRWKNLLNLDVIRLKLLSDDAIVLQERNKPKDAPRKPKSAPFFLPTVAGLVPKFELPQEEDIGDKTGKSKILTGSANLLSEFGLKLEKTRITQNYASFVDHLITLGPSATEVELSLLAPTGVDSSVELMIDFINVLNFMFETKRNVDLAVSYLGLFIKLHSDLLSTNEELSERLERLEQIQDDACDEVLRQTNRILCLSEYLRGVTL